MLVLETVIDVLDGIDEGVRETAVKVDDTEINDTVATLEFFDEIEVT